MSGTPKCRCHFSGFSLRPASIAVVLTLNTGICVAASDAVPFATIDNGPLAQAYASPAAEEARVTEPKKTRWRLSYLASNQYVKRTAGQETITLDGETTRGALAVTRGVGDGSEVGAELPFVAHRGGGLDRFIDSFHDAFSLPDGGRSQAPRNRLLYLYQRGGQDVLRITEADEGIGDARLHFGKQLFYATAPGTWNTALRASIKFPTGDSASLLGSGSTDYAFWFSTACDDGACPLALRWYGTAGLMYLGDGDVLPQQQKHLAAFGNLGIAWPWTENVMFKVQIDAHTPLFADTDLKALGANSFQLVGGGSWRITSGSTIDFALAEDISVETAPDVSFLLAWRYDR
jgi:hypothetical protein